MYVPNRIEWLSNKLDVKIELKLQIKCDSIFIIIFRSVGVRVSLELYSFDTLLNGLDLFRIGIRITRLKVRIIIF